LKYLTDFGEWNDVVRELADHNPLRYADVIRIPLAEALHCYEHVLREDARRDYELRSLLYVIKNSSGMGKRVGKPPELPAIMKGAS
jgi:hypothetical protein